MISRDDVNFSVKIICDVEAKNVEIQFSNVEDGDIDTPEMLLAMLYLTIIETLLEQGSTVDAMKNLIDEAVNRNKLLAN